MPVWREAIPREIRQSWPTLERRTLVVLHGSNVPGGPFEVFCRRWTGASELPPFGPHAARNPDQVIEYRAPGRPTFPTFEEARECAQDWVRMLPDFHRERFEAQIATPPPVRVAELTGSDPSLRTWVMLHHDGRFEVRCFHREVVAATEDGSHLEWDWVRIRSAVAIFADDLEEAGVAAREELKQAIR